MHLYSFTFLRSKKYLTAPITGLRRSKTSNSRGFYWFLQDGLKCPLRNKAPRRRRPRPLRLGFLPVEQRPLRSAPFGRACNFATSVSITTAICRSPGGRRRSPQGGRRDRERGVWADQRRRRLARIRPRRTDSTMTPLIRIFFPLGAEGPIL